MTTLALRTAFSTGSQTACFFLSPVTAKTHMTTLNTEKNNYFCARAILLNFRLLVNTAVTIITLAAANAIDPLLIPPA